MSTTTVITPMFRMSYPNLFKPRKNELNGKNEYTVTALFKMGEDLKKVEAAIEAACVNKWGPDSKKWPKNLRTPLKDQATRAKENEETGKTIMPDGYRAGAMMLNLKSEEAPGMVDQKVQPILDETKIYAGCWARAKIVFFAYDQKGNRGVSCQLHHIQKVRDDKPIGGSRGVATDAFDPLEDSESPGELTPEALFT